MEQIIEFITSDNIKNYVGAIGSVVVASKAITVLTPTKLDDQALGIVGKVINIILRILNTTALNVGKDKNADDK